MRISQARRAIARRQADRIRKVAGHQRPPSGRVIIVMPAALTLAGTILHRLGVVRPAATADSVTVVEVDAQTFAFAIRQTPLTAGRWKQRQRTDEAWEAVVAELLRMGVDVNAEPFVASIIRAWGEEQHALRSEQAPALVRDALADARALLHADRRDRHA